MRLEDALEIASGVSCGKLVTDLDMETAIVALYSYIRQHKQPVGAIGVEKILDGVRKEIQNLRVGAAHAGERGDGGASILENNLKWYIRGLEGVYPTEWERYAYESDPEYAEYLRLREKFDKR